ncbi:MAG: hypothetical protein AAF430_13255 [Myxococcota bacterium]
MRARRSTSPWLLALLLLVSCRTERPWDSLRGNQDDPCGNLAYAFYMIAEQRDRRVPKEKQLETLQKSVQSPFVTQPSQAYRGLVAIVDRVYAAPETTPERFEAEILGRCTVDTAGRAVVGSERPHAAPTRPDDASKPSRPQSPVRQSSQ